MIEETGLSQILLVSVQVGRLTYTLMYCYHHHPDSEMRGREREREGGREREREEEREREIGWERGRKGERGWEREGEREREREREKGRKREREGGREGERGTVSIIIDESYLWHLLAKVNVLTLQILSSALVIVSQQSSPALHGPDIKTHSWSKTHVCCTTPPIAVLIGLLSQLSPIAGHGNQYPS